MGSKKPVCLLVRTSIRSIPPSGDLTKLLITLPCAAQSGIVHVHLCTFLVGRVSNPQPSEPKVEVCVETQQSVKFANLTRRQVSLNSKHRLIVKLCFRYVQLFVTVISAVGGWDKKVLKL